MINKKAVKLTMNLVVGVIIMGVIIMILMPFLWNLGPLSEEQAILRACEQSLDRAEGVKVFGQKIVDGRGDEVDLMCPTQYIETGNEGDDLLVEFADYIYQCFGTYRNRGNIFDHDAGTYCINCKSIKSIKAKKMDGLIDYFSANHIPVYEASERITYLDAFGGAISFAADNKYNSIELIPGEDMVIVATFGTKGFKGTHLIFNAEKEVGFLLHPRKDLASLGCYSFEASSTLLELIDTSDDEMDSYLNIQ